MSELDRLERDLTVWFAETGVPRTPPYLDDILRQTALRGQRPRWTFLERLLPMTATASFRAATGRLPWRSLGVLALLIVGLVVGAIVVGSMQSRLPEPFGPARAGLVAYAMDGDIFVADPTTNERRLIVAGGATDVGPQWSRDGKRIVFERRENGETRLLTVRPDGSALTVITPNSTYIADDADGPNYSFSPDGRFVLFVSFDGIEVASSDGSGVRTLKTPANNLGEVAWRPPDGAQIAVVGSGGVYLVDVVDGAVQTLVAPKDGIQMGGLFWSPDGSQLAYNPWWPAEVFTVRAHIIDVASRQDRLADPDLSSEFWDAPGPWSNDGERLILVRGHADSGYEDVTAAIVPTSGTGSPVGTAHGVALIRECCATFDWAPDDSSILWSPTDGSGRPEAQLLIDPETGTVTPAPWQAISDPAWQRLAP
jgi:Tol biopolymer transport system component